LPLTHLPLLYCTPVPPVPQARESLDRSVCWPAAWVAKELPEARLLSLEYAAPASGWEVRVAVLCCMLKGAVLEPPPWCLPGYASCVALPPLSACWPATLPACPPLSAACLQGESLPFQHTVAQLMEKLAAAGVGQRPVIFVCHR
jgi:hypothetical protein